MACVFNSRSRFTRPPTLIPASADFLASLVLNSPHSMPTTAPEADVYATASLAVLAPPLSTKDKHMVLSAATTKLVSPESQLDFFVDCLYLDFGEKLSELLNHLSSAAMHRD